MFDNATIGVAARYRPHLMCQYWQEATDDDNYMIRLITSKNSGTCFDRKQNAFFFFRSVHIRFDGFSDKKFRTDNFK